MKINFTEITHKNSTIRCVFVFHCEGTRKKYVGQTENLYKRIQSIKQGHCSFELFNLLKTLPKVSFDIEILPYDLKLKKELESKYIPFKRKKAPKAVKILSKPKIRRTIPLSEITHLLEFWRGLKPTNKTSMQFFDEMISKKVAISKNTFYNVFHGVNPSINPETFITIFKFCIKFGYKPNTPVKSELIIRKIKY